MERFYGAVVARKKLILALFILAALAGLVLRGMVGVNYDINDYLPAGTASTVSLEVMGEEFPGGIPNALAAVPGVEDVSWLDDSADLAQPLDALDPDLLNNYYQNGAALYSVTVSEEDYVAAVEGMRAVIGPDGAMTGQAVSQASSATCSVMISFSMIIPIFTRRMIEKKLRSSFSPLPSAI